jgi:hypothetical protein
MANRADEKARRREERRVAEEAERKAAARKQRLGIIGGVVGALAVAGVAAALVLGSGGSGDGGDDDTARRTAPTKTVAIPPAEISDYEEAAKAAGCELKHPPIEGAGHDERDFTAADYKTNPPTSGDHNPIWYEDGIYEPGNVPRLGMLVHTLEHGRINLQYKPGLAANEVTRLESLFAELEDGYHMLLYENTTEMPYEVAATAWGHLLGCPKMNDDVFDAVRTFRQRYIDKGPENVP